MDVLVHLLGLREGANASVATRYEKLPFDLLWLDLCCAFEVPHSLLVHFVANEICAKPVDHLHVHRQVSVLCVVWKGVYVCI